MLYPYFRSLSALSLHLYVKRVGWSGLEHIPKDKPVLFCCTHSNSFMDALFLCSYLGRPVYALARGDAFKKPVANNILRQFKLLPIFRQQDGEKDAAAKNEQTFQACQTLFEQNQYVLIFPEGVCKHQTELLPLKTGAAIMAQRAWESGLDVQIVPVGITYDSFWNWGKKCDVIFGKAISKTEFSEEDKGRVFLKKFNDKVGESMQTLFPSPQKFRQKPIHFGLLGQIFYYLAFALQFPLYFLAQFIGKKIAGKTIFYDSAIIGILAVLLPFYWLLLTGLYLFFR